NAGAGDPRELAGGVPKPSPRPVPPCDDRRGGGGEAFANTWLLNEHVPRYHAMARRSESMSRHVAEELARERAVAGTVGMARTTPASIPPASARTTLMPAASISASSYAPVPPRSRPHAVHACACRRRRPQAGAWAALGLLAPWWRSPASPGAARADPGLGAW